MTRYIEETSGEFLLQGKCPPLAQRIRNVQGTAPLQSVAGAPACSIFTAANSGTPAASGCLVFASLNLICRTVTSERFCHAGLPLCAWVSGRAACLPATRAERAEMLPAAAAVES